MEIITRIIDATPRNFHLGGFIAVVLSWGAYFFWRNHFSSKAVLEKKKGALEILKLLHEMKSLSIDNFDAIKTQIAKEAESVLLISDNVAFPPFRFPKFPKLIKWFKRSNWLNTCIGFAIAFFVTLIYWALVFSRYSHPRANDVNALLFLGGLTLLLSFVLISVLVMILGDDTPSTILLSLGLAITSQFLFPPIIGFILEFWAKVLTAYAN